MLSRLLYRLILFVTSIPKPSLKAIALILFVLVVGLPVGGMLFVLYQENSDTAADRGAIAMADGELGESFSTPQYLDQGWDASDSLFFYNTTQGSALLPYDFFLALERKDGARGTCAAKNDRIAGDAPWFLCDRNVDHFRYLPQRATVLNPDALPVGFAKTAYKGKDYVGYTCAACHTGQVNFKGQALRIDGGPAMADMVGFLKDLQAALAKVVPDPGQASNPDFEKFADRVIALGNDYGTRGEVETDLRKWLDIRERYNSVNSPFYRPKDAKGRGEIETCGPNADGEIEFQRVDYGYARLDAFGRIYNRVLQHTINAPQLADVLRSITSCKNVPAGGLPKRIMTDPEIDLVMADFRQSGDVVLRDEHLNQILRNLVSDKPGYPDLSQSDMLRLRNALFNSPNAPVSYPFLWDITRSDFVQWNGLANNATLGPLGRNAGEVIGVFAILDWHKEKGFFDRFKFFNPAVLSSGQVTKKQTIRFESSIDLVNLQRLEQKLGSLTSPAWPFCRSPGSAPDDPDAYYLPSSAAEPYVDRRPCRDGDISLDAAMVDRGRGLFERHCAACHDVIDPRDPDRVMISFMLGIDRKNATDEAMAENSVNYVGKAGNFKDTYQNLGLGNMIMPEEAPVAQLLTAVTKGSLTTTDRSVEGILRWLLTFVRSLADNPVLQSMKAGNYTPDTTASPFASLKSYRARSLNGIWATAPYLHNGSVPTLYDLLLPVAPGGNCVEQQARPRSFHVGAREFDPAKVGFISTGEAGFLFQTRDPRGKAIRGNDNRGHEYGACAMTHQDRMDLIEYLKSLSPREVAQ